MDSYARSSVRFVPSTRSPHVRRNCYQINISVDSIHENTESFILDLTSEEESDNVIVDPSMTEVFIFDHDGKHIN